MIKLHVFVIILVTKFWIFCSFEIYFLEVLDHTGEQQYNLVNTSALIYIPQCPGAEEMSHPIYLT